MVSQGLRRVVMAGAVLFLFGAVASDLVAASVWVQHTQLEQYWIGSQWKDSTSDTTEWDSYGLATSIIHAVNEGTNGLINNTLVLNEYDPEHEQTQTLMRAYDKAQGLWDDTLLGTKWTRLKDANQRDTIVELQTLNPKDQKWYKQTRWKYHYYQNLLIDTSIVAVWDTSGGVGKWMNTMRTVETYNTSIKKSVVTTVDTWSKGDMIWLKTMKTFWVYDNNGLLVADTAATWDTTDSKYIYSLLHVYAYNANNKDTSKITMSYSKALDAFLNVQREIYEYDNNGNQTVYTVYRWTKNPSGTGLWLQTNRTTKTYNAKSKILTTLYESYDSSGSQWNKGNYEEWAYDGNDNATSETFSTWDTTADPDKFVPTRKLTWTYIQITVGTVQPDRLSKNTAAKSAIRIKTNKIIISGREGMTVTIFGINGRRFASLTAPKGQSMVSWNYADSRGQRVPMGSYVIKVNAPGLKAVFPVSICR